MYAGPSFDTLVVRGEVHPLIPETPQKTISESAKTILPKQTSVQRMLHFFIIRIPLFSPVLWEGDVIKYGEGLFRTPAHGKK